MYIDNRFIATFKTSQNNTARIERIFKIIVIDDTGLSLNQYGYYLWINSERCFYSKELIDYIILSANKHGIELFMDSNNEFITFDIKNTKIQKQKTILQEKLLLKTIKNYMEET